MNIMKIKQADGSIVEVPIGKGADGKSAYEYAKQGGYTGTEAEFIAMLADNSAVTAEKLKTARTITLSGDVNGSVSFDGSGNVTMNTTVANLPDIDVNNIDASKITSGTLSSDRLPTVPIAKGGTGATTAAAALTNLGAAPAYQYSSTDLTAGTSSLTTGTLYFVYE